MSIIEKAMEKLERAKRSKSRWKETYPAESEPSESPGPLAGQSDEAWMPLKGVSDYEDACAVTPVNKVATTTRTAVLDATSLGPDGLVTPQTANSALLEQFRHIKRQLLADAPQDNANAIGISNLIMITSPLPAEGKTFIATNLAMSITMERDRNVLLVDADMAKTDLCRMFGVEGEPGLTDFLSDPELALSDVLVKTNIPKLTFLPTGHPTQDMTELLASGKMKRLTCELSQRYPDRVVIFDSMPLLSKAGASVLAALMGQVVVVVEAANTPHAALRDALALLNNSDYVRLVLNKCQRRRGSRDRHGYYSGYG